MGSHEGSADESTRQTGWYFISGGLDGKHRRVCFREDRRQDTLRVTVNGTTYNFTNEKDPTQVSPTLVASNSVQIRAPFSGKLVRWIVPSGSAVYKGTPYAEIEIMKLYVQLTCDASGLISHSLVRHPQNFLHEWLTCLSLLEVDLCMSELGSLQIFMFAVDVVCVQICVCVVFLCRAKELYSRAAICWQL